MPEKVDLVNLAGGAAVEKFQAELDRVLKNIRDPNTDPTASREITLKIKIKPSVNRDLAAVAIYTQAKLADDAPIPTQFFLSQRGPAEAFESNMHQIEMQVEPKREPAPVANLRKEGSE